MAQPQDRQLGFTALVFVLTSVPFAFSTGVRFPGGEPAATAFSVLPAIFFGLALAMLTLSRWQDRLLPVLASPIVYWGATKIVEWSHNTIPEAGCYIIAGIFGAALMTLLLAGANTMFLRAAPWAALAGAAGGAAFYAVTLLEDALPAMATPLLAYAAWQVPVGLYLVQFRRKLSGRLF